MTPSAMKHLQCSVCLRAASHCHYGVACCDACRMFFQRVHYSKYPVKECRGDQKCFEKKASVLKCRYCRFQQCVRVGMTTRVLKNVDYNMMFRSKCKKLTVMLAELAKLDERREINFLHSLITDDPTVMELVCHTGIFVEKPAGTVLSTLDWWFQEAFTAIDMMKKLEFLIAIKQSERAVVIYNSFSNMSVFISAMRSYRSNCHTMVFPGGVDVFPEGFGGWPGSPLQQMTRCQLVERLFELRITNEEFLLLTAIFFCNPAIANVSETGRMLLTSYRNMYNSALFNYCMLSYQQSGPSRLADLLSLCHVINTTVGNMRAHCMFLNYYQPICRMKSLVKEFLDVK